MLQILGDETIMKDIQKCDSERNKLEYVEIKVGQGTLLTMMENSATHNFKREEATRKFGLNFIPTQSCLKVVKYPPTQVIGVAEHMEVKIGE